MFEVPKLVSVETTAAKDGVLFALTKDTSILFKTPASLIKSSSVEAGAVAYSV